MNGLVYVRPGNGWLPHPDLHIYSKIEVNGQDGHPMYNFLKSACPQAVPVFEARENLFYDPVAQNDVYWNYEKFLIDRNGVPRWRFAPSTWGANGEFVEPYLQALLNNSNQVKDRSKRSNGKGRNK